MAIYALAAVVIIVTVLTARLIIRGTSVKIPKENVAQFKISVRAMEDLKVLSDKYRLNYVNVLTLYALENNFFPVKYVNPVLEEIEQKYFMDYAELKKKYERKNIRRYEELLQSIISDIKYFPIVASTEGDESVSYIYGDSFGLKNSDSKNSNGTDIINRENLRGIVPVVSMTAGYIKELGWDDVYGYYAGVRADSGNYYFYGHLDSTADGLAKGARVNPGQYLGLMGDSGNGKKSAGTPNYPVHLHVGISPDKRLFGSNFWINPYPFLRHIEYSKIDKAGLGL